MKTLLKEKGDMKLYKITGMTSFSCQCFHDCGCGDGFVPEPFEFYKIEKENSRSYRANTEKEINELWKKLSAYMFRNLNEITLTDHEKKVVENKYSVMTRILLDEYLDVWVSNKGNIVAQKRKLSDDSPVGREENYGPFLDFAFDEIVYEQKKKVYWEPKYGDAIDIDKMERRYMLNIIKRMAGGKNASDVRKEEAIKGFEKWRDEDLRELVKAIAQSRENAKYGVGRGYGDWDDFGGDDMMLYPVLNQ